PPSLNNQRSIENYYYAEDNEESVFHAYHSEKQESKLRAVVYRTQIHSNGQTIQARNEQHPTNHPEYREDLQRRVDSGSREVHVSASSRNQDLSQPHRIFSSQA